MRRRRQSPLLRLLALHRRLHNAPPPCLGGVRRLLACESDEDAILGAAYECELTADTFTVRDVEWTEFVLKEYGVRCRPDGVPCVTGERAREFVLRAVAEFVRQEQHAAAVARCIARSRARR